MNQNTRNFLIWGAIAALGLFQLIPGAGSNRNLQHVAFSDFLNDVENSRVEEVVIKGQIVAGKLKDGRLFSTHAPFDPDLVKNLHQKGVRITAGPVEEDFPFLHMFFSWLPILLLIGLWVSSLNSEK